MRNVSSSKGCAAAAEQVTAEEKNFTAVGLEGAFQSALALHTSRRPGEIAGGLPLRSAPKTLACSMPRIEVRTTHRSSVRVHAPRVSAQDVRSVQKAPGSAPSPPAAPRQQGMPSLGTPGGCRVAASTASLLAKPNHSQPLPLPGFAKLQKI